MLAFIVLLAAAQVQTIKLPPPPPTGVATLKLAPDLVVKEIRIENDTTMHVLVANTGTGAVGKRFPVRASVEIGGESLDLGPDYADPLPAGGEAWVKLKSNWTTRLTQASSAVAGADLYPEPKDKKTGWVWWPTISTSAILPGMEADCTSVTGCIAELDESNNSYAIAGVPRGTPERLNAPELAPERAPERG